MAFVCFNCSAPGDDGDVNNGEFDSDDDDEDESEDDEDTNQNVNRGVKRAADVVDVGSVQQPMSSGTDLTTIGLFSSISIVGRVDAFRKLVLDTLARPAYQQFMKEERERVEKTPENLVLSWNDFAPTSNSSIHSISVNTGVFSDIGKTKLMSLRRFVARVGMAKKQSNDRTTRVRG